jgi:hypothetical protein
MKSSIWLRSAVIAGVCLALLAPLSVMSQTVPAGWVNVWAANTMDGGALIQNGTIAFQPVNNAGQPIGFRAAGGNGATATAIFGVTIASQTPGSGYGGTWSCAVTGGTYTTAATCTATVSSGGLIFAITSPGAYTALPTGITFSGGTYTAGTPAAVSPGLTLSGTTVISGGSGYAVTTASFPGCSGSISSAVTVASGAVTAITASGGSCPNGTVVLILGAGQVGPDPLTAVVTEGAFSIWVPDSILATPQNVCYSATIANNVTGRVQSGPGLTCVQPAASGAAVTSSQAWCVAGSGGAGGSCDFDLYTLNEVPLVAVQRGPAGPTGPTGPAGPAGQNNVTTSSGTNISGVLAGNGANVQAATSTQVQTALGYAPLAPANNLSDVSRPLAALTNLGALPIAGTYLGSTPVALTANSGTNAITIRCAGSGCPIPDNGTNLGDLGISTPSLQASTGSFSGGVSSNGLPIYSTALQGLAQGFNQGSTTQPVISDTFSAAQYYDPVNYPTGKPINSLTLESGNSQWSVSGAGGATSAFVNPSGNPSQPVGYLNFVLWGNPTTTTFYASAKNTTTLGGTPQPIYSASASFIVCPAAGSYTPVTDTTGTLIVQDSTLSLNHLIHLQIGAYGWSLQAGDTVPDFTNIASGGYTIPIDCKTPYPVGIVANYSTGQIQVITPSGPSPVFTYTPMETWPLLPSAITLQERAVTGAAQVEFGGVSVGGPSEAEKLIGLGGGAPSAYVKALYGAYRTTKYFVPMFTVPAVGSPTTEEIRIATAGVLATYMVSADYEVTVQNSACAQTIKFTVDTNANTAIPYVNQNDEWGTCTLVSNVIASNDGSANIGVDLVIASAYSTYANTFTITQTGIGTPALTFPVGATPYTCVGCNAKTLTIAPPSAPYSASLTGGAGWYTIVTAAVAPSCAGGYCAYGSVTFKAQSTYATQTGTLYFEATPAMCILWGMNMAGTQTGGNNSIFAYARCSTDAASNIHIDVDDTVSSANGPVTLTYTVTNGKFALNPTPTVGAVVLTGGAAPPAILLQNGQSSGLVLTDPLVAGTGAQTLTGCSLSNLKGGAAAGSFVSGTTGTCTVTITPGITAPNGFTCSAHDLTTPTDVLSQTTTTTTTCTVAGTTVTGDLVTYGVTAF